MNNHRIMDGHDAADEAVALQRQLFRYAEDLNSLMQMIKGLESLMGVVASGYLLTSMDGVILKADNNGRKLLGLAFDAKTEAGSICDFIGVNYRSELESLLQLLDPRQQSADSASPAGSANGVIKWDCVITELRRASTRWSHIFG